MVFEPFSGRADPARVPNPSLPSLHPARIMHEPPAATADMAVLLSEPYAL